MALSDRLSPSNQGEPTRERLLKSAERLFARRGYALTSVRAITREAACNIAAVNYHFNGKHNLYREMFRQRTAALREQRISRIRLAMDEAGKMASLETVLEAFANAFVEPLADESRGRTVMELMTRELLDPQLPPGFFLSEMILPVQEALAEAIRTVEPGIPQRAVRMCIQSFVGQLIHVLRMRTMAQRSEQPSEVAFPLPESVQHIVCFTAAGIRAYTNKRGSS
ncbi:MAG: CerR family C-terminal domain-containing protein [bacterium]